MSWNPKTDLFPAAARRGDGKRPQRVADVIQREISALLITRMKDPRLAPVSIVSVVMTKDLKRARINYSVFGDAEQAERRPPGWPAPRVSSAATWPGHWPCGPPRTCSSTEIFHWFTRRKWRNSLRSLPLMTIQPNETVDRIASELQDKRNILLATHIFPDGDALGSQLALGSILESLGKKVYYYGEARVSHIYDFMPGAGLLDNRLPDPARFDAAVALDCGDCFRLGRRMDELLTIHPFMVIDHHAGHKEFGDLRWVDPARSSTGEMVYELATRLGGSISPAAAFCLLTAIVSDTGSFKYESTSANTFRVAGELVARGGRPSEVAGKLFDNFTPGRLQLLQKVLATLELHSNDRIAMITVTSEMLTATGTTRDDTEDFVNYPRSLNTVRAAAFLKEAGNGWVGVSLRAKGECDVARIAAIFGGGGHRNAAGFRLQGTTLAAVRADLLRELQAAMAAGC